MNESIPPSDASAVSEDARDGGLAHETWAAAQLAPGEGIEDGVARIQALIDAAMTAKGE